jgi:hypothetical protein
MTASGGDEACGLYGFGEKVLGRLDHVGTRISGREHVTDVRLGHAGSLGDRNLCDAAPLQTVLQAC